MSINIATTTVAPTDSHRRSFFLMVAKRLLIFGIGLAIYFCVKPIPEVKKYVNPEMTSTVTSLEAHSYEKGSRRNKKKKKRKPKKKPKEEPKPLTPMVYEIFLIIWVVMATLTPRPEWLGRIIYFSAGVLLFIAVEKVLTGLGAGIVCFIYFRTTWSRFGSRYVPGWIFERQDD